MLLAGLGQGTAYTGPRLLFPYAMLDAAYPKILSGDSLTIAALQFPLYGLILGAVYGSRRFPFVVVALITFHIVAVLVLSPFAPLS